MIITYKYTELIRAIVYGLCLHNFNFRILRESQNIDPSFILLIFLDKDTTL